MANTLPSSIPTPAHLTRDDGLPLGWNLIERQPVEEHKQ